MLEAKKTLPTLEELQEKFEGHAPEALVDAFQMLGEAESEGKTVFESTSLSNDAKLARLAELERKWLEAVQLINFWSSVSTSGNTEN